MFILNRDRVKKLPFWRCEKEEEIRNWYSGNKTFPPDASNLLRLLYFFAMTTTGFFFVIKGNLEIFLDLQIYFYFCKNFEIKTSWIFLKLLYDFMDCVFATRITGKCNLPSTPHKNNFSNKLKSHRLFACLAQWCKMNFNQTNNLTLRWIFPFPYIVCTWERENFSSVFFLFCINQQCRHIMKSFALFS